MKRGTPASTHIENRGPTALSNPYLVGAALLSAGLAGIEQGLQPPDPSGDAPRRGGLVVRAAPDVAGRGARALEGEPHAKAFFGDEFLTAYTTMRRYELSRFNDWVTDWERKEYLEIF